MKLNETLETANHQSENSGFDPNASVEDFIRELEEKEKDLHITAELQIEVSESEIDDSNLPEFIIEDLNSSHPISQEMEPHVTTAATQTRLKSEIAELENTISKFKAERSEILERSRRQAEDFENFRKRTDRERHERLSAQMENLAKQMLPVLDNLNRVLDFAMSMTDEMRNANGPFFDGIVMVNQQVHEVMAGMGVQPIKSVREEFDPRLHEAVAIDFDASLPPNTVSQEMLRGYRIGNRVIRHSMVKVTPPDANSGAPSSPGDRADSGIDLSTEE